MQEGRLLPNYDIRNLDDKDGDKSRGFQRQSLSFEMSTSIPAVRTTSSERPTT